MIDRLHYIYIYLDPTQPGKWKYKDLIFNYRPFYVGLGQGNRMNIHMCESSRIQNNIKNIFINRIIEDTSKSPIFYKIYESLTLDEAEKIEIDIISHFGRIDLKTGILGNMAPGGKILSENFVVGQRKQRKLKPKDLESPVKGSKHPKSQSFIQMDKDRNILRVWDSLHQISRELGFDRGNIKTAALLDREACGFYWKSNGTLYTPPVLKCINGKKRNVFQYTLEGTFVRSFNSIIEAARYMNLKAGTSIQNVCKKRKKSSAGFQWFYSYQGPSVESIVFNRYSSSWKQVASYDFFGNLVKIYPSTTHASAENGNISRALLRHSTANGLYWRYYYG